MTLGIKDITQNTVTIKVSHDRPPVPVKFYDWSAYVDELHPDGPVGYGETKHRAIYNLLIELEDIYETGEGHLE